MGKMKKIAFALMIIFVLSGCDSIPDGVVDVESADYDVSEVLAPSAFVYTTKDSIINHSIYIKNTEKIAKVTYKLITHTGQILISEEMPFKGDISKHDKEYYAETPMSSQDYSGYYEFRYFVTDNLGNNSENTKEVVAHKFYYNNGQDNEPPVISDKLIYYFGSEPEIINTAETIKFIVLSVEAKDPNGPNDLKSVYYQLYNPDSNRVVNSTGRFDFPMFDNGEPDMGDEIRGDGRYSTLIKFPSNSQKGEWRFEFFAKDHSGEVSNKIEHKLVLE